MSILDVFKNGAQKKANTVESKPVKVAKSTKPDNDTINLDKYYKSGFKNSEHDEKAARTVREDILSRYNIDDNDSNKERKLTRIYLDIIDDVKNKPLLKNYEKRDNANKEADDEDFLKNVELTMAYMMHDGTSTGDKITLGDVDFSDIGDEEDKNSGKLEAETVDSGIKYTVYDENGNIIHFTSRITDKKGYTIISTSLDGCNTISKETVIEFPKTDDEIKFKFVSGNQNTVNFKDEGSTVSVELTKGVLREEYTIEKNSDGTYELDGKHYYTIEEIAMDMNKKELQPKMEFDGTINASSQGKIGDCDLISAINSLNSTEIGRNVIKNAVSIDEEGNMTVNFRGINRSYVITQDEFSSKQYFSSGDQEVRAIELAWEKMLTEVKNEVLILQGKNYHETSYDLIEKEKRGQNYVSGTRAASVYELLVGKRSYFNGSSFVESDLIRCLDILETQANRAMTVGNRPENKGGLRYGDSANITKTTYSDAYGNNISISDYHSYAVKEVDTKADGTKIITVINPYNSAQEIVLDEDTFLSAFNTASDVDFSYDDMKPAYRLA